MADGTQELESRISPVVELGQTGLDSCLAHYARFAFRATYVESVSEACDVAHLISCNVLQVAQERIQIRVADFDTSAQCCMEALQYVVGNLVRLRLSRTLKRSGPISSAW